MPKKQPKAVFNRANLINRLAGKPGLRGKVDAHCVSCIYDPEMPGTWRQQVGNCLVVDCPLYSARTKGENQQ
jgi:hypothetical protein